MELTRLSIYLSNTWYLEKVLGFNGVSVEPNSAFSHKFIKYRSKTHFINKALVPAGPEKKTINYYKCDSDVLSTTDPMEFVGMSTMGYKFESIDVDVITTAELLQYYDSRIGVLFIDIESLPLQLELLREIICTRIKPFIICVETLDFSPGSKNLRQEYDKILNNNYAFIAGTYLNSIYLCSSIPEN